MTNEELREKAGRMLREHGAHECVAWEELHSSIRESYCRQAWPLVQLGLAAGLREAAGMLRANHRNFDPERLNAIEEAHACNIEARAKEVEHV